jgi:hypothetical protein
MKNNIQVGNCLVVSNTVRQKITLNPWICPIGTIREKGKMINFFISLFGFRIRKLYNYNN